MRNLLNIKHAAYQLNPALPLTAQAWDTATDSIVCAFGPAAGRDVIELRRVQDLGARAQNEHALIASWDAPSPLPDLAVDRIVSLHHFGHSETTCLVLAGGDIVVIRSQPVQGQDKIEIVGSVDAGIKAAAWSPDEELLAVATGADTLIFMTADFDSVANVSFDPDDAKLSKHVDVGWGKKETQFQGKRAKAMRDPTMPEHVDEGIISHNDKGDAVISWRGDGAYVAVNTIENKSRRMIRVFTREGNLDSVTEPVDGLESALSWRPAGNLLAGIQRKDEDVKVVFFERNGLRHGQFSLRLSREEAATWGSHIDLQWNSDSSVLAVRYCDRTQFWTMSNYHYYLKQEERFECIPSRHPNLTWHPEQPLRLTIAPPGEEHVSAGTSLRVLEYIFTVSKGSTIAPHDLGTVAVIDGTNMKLTPIRVANVPPPMALHEITLEVEAIDVAVNLSNTKIAVLHRTSFTILSYDPRISLGPVIERIEDLPISDFVVARQICYKGDDEVLVLMNNLLTNESLVYDCLNQQESQIPNSTNVLRLFPSADYSALFLATEDMVKQVDTLENTTGLLEATTVATIPAPAPWVEVVQCGEETIVVTLTASGTLSANERQLIRNCTSFVLAQSHLILTTSNHFLKFIHLCSDVSDMQIPPDTPEDDERCRNIERGAKLVTVMPSAYCLTLQMPRGNLETIFPRALVLAGIRRSIDGRRYKKAFLACRSQRVDMNIIYDHAPDAFLENVALFVDQVKKVEYLDLFLSQLREEDVTQTIYKDTTVQQSTVVAAIPRNNNVDGMPIDATKDSKVNRICDAFLAVLVSRFSTNLQNVITAHVCKVPPNIEAGLDVVSNLRESQPDMADSAVEHICFLADVNRVYDAALGMYSLDLALLVAQQSQKDPREYLPYMQSLQGLPELRRRFTIDDDLGRHRKALQHLYELKVVEEVQLYTQKHSLYTEALDLYRYDTTSQSLIMRSYASHLHSRNRYKEAAIAYTFLSDHASASSSYRLANLWSPCLTSALLANLPAEELTALAESLVDHLTETHDHISAAIIHHQHLSDLPSALRSLCRAHAFTHATRLAALNSRPDLISGILDPGLIDASATLTELLADMKAQLHAQVPRLRDLRKLKAADPLAFFEGMVTGAEDVPDNVSIAPSATSTVGGASLFTRYGNGTQAGGNQHGTSTINTTTTRKTSKNRRREERKRARGKKGSVYEEEYLVMSVGRLVERVNEIAADVTETVEGLLSRGMRERARAVEGAMAEVVAVCEAVVGEVWEVDISGKNVALDGEEGVEEGGGGARPAGADGVLWESLGQQWKKNGPPAVRKFEPSGLL